MKMNAHRALCLGVALTALSFGSVAKAQESTLSSVSSTSHVLPALPANLPKWLDSKRNNEIFYQRGPYNFSIYDIPSLARDMNGVAVGHSLAYEALVTGRERTLENTVFGQIDRVLKNPPKLMPAERVLSPTFAQKYGPLETLFDWTHVSHAQTIDNFVSTRADNAQKDKETTALWDYYKKQGAPFVVTSLPMNMAWLDSQPYSQAFRRKYPKVNALFWGYHWLQTSVYDGLRGKTQAEQKLAYAQLGQRYHDVELYNTKRPFMPMMAETSPNFAAKYPDIANGFDNLHMLHDMVNDILASDWMTESQKNEQVKRVVYMMSADAHKDCKPGENRGVIDGISHDHRFMEGMPGMGMMKTGLPVAASAGMTMAGMDHGSERTMETSAKTDAKFDPTEMMWMPEMGWMNMSQCHHCSMPLDNNGIGDAAWKASTVSADGWTMRVRCALCARDMSAEVKGGAILSLATEDPNRPVTVFSDDKGNLTTLAKGVVFLEEKAGHEKCSQWSQAFTSQEAFDAYIHSHPKFRNAKSLTFAQWSQVEPAGTPATYYKEEGPVENPYAADLNARGVGVDGDMGHRS